MKHGISNIFGTGNPKIVVGWLVEGDLQAVTQNKQREKRGWVKQNSSLLSHDEITARKNLSHS